MSFSWYVVGFKNDFGFIFFIKSNSFALYRVFSNVKPGESTIVMLFNLILIKSIVVLGIKLVVTGSIFVFSISFNLFINVDLPALV